MARQSIAKLRHEYGNTPLEVCDDPLRLFAKWLKEAVHAEVMEPNAMTLATVSEVGHPSARTVLLKGLEKGTFVFYTHFDSRKGHHLEEDCHAALVFWWRDLYRQVTVEGRVRRVSRSQARAYFASRPRGAQLAALASHQSAPLACREELEDAFKSLKRRYQGKPVPCPTSWGGYRLTPNRIEFWQGRANRLHDRALYLRPDGDWVRTLLAP